MDFFKPKPKHQWNAGQVPTARSAYVNTRQLELQQERDVNVRTALELLDQDLEKWVYRRSPSMRELREAYQKIHMGLQNADLTINFEAFSWFRSENKYDSYTQLYERGLDSDGELRVVADPNNPIQTRVAADDAVTIPEEWRGTQPVARGLAPRQNQVRIAQRMIFDQPVANGQNAQGRTGVKSSNPHFDAKSKQVFAALNFGRRPHGATNSYGYSFLVLKPHLKVNAFYYPGDTFGLARTGTSTQVSFAQLGAIYGKITGPSGDRNRQDVLTSCFAGIPMANESSMTMLLEAHLFADVRFADALESVNLCRQVLPGKEPFNEEQWEWLKGNAKKFTKRWGVKLNIVP